MSASCEADLKDRLPQYAAEWAMAPFALFLIGHTGHVPLHQCSVPLGIKVPTHFDAMILSLLESRYLTEQAFGFTLLSPYGALRVLPAQRPLVP